MKIKISLIMLLVVAALLLAFGAAYAQSTGFSLSWWTVDGGGGVSSATGYKLSGTSGQPDAGSLTGGSYQLQGGFWNIPTEKYFYLPLVLR